LSDLRKKQVEIGKGPGREPQAERAIGGRNRGKKGESANLKDNFFIYILVKRRVFHNLLAWKKGEADREGKQASAMEMR